MSGRTGTASLILTAMLGFGWLACAHAATADCSLPIAQLTTAQFEGCLGVSRAPAKTIPLRIGEFDEYVAPKPTTQHAYDTLLHAGD